MADMNANQDQNMNQKQGGQMSQGMNGGAKDVTGVIKDQVSTALGSVVEQLEPQLNEFAHNFADQAVDRSKELATSAYYAARRQPWYLVGAAAFLLIGAAVIIGFGAREMAEDVQPS